MHVISRKALEVFWTRYPDSKRALSRWFHIVERTDFAHFADLRATFPSADKVGDFIVFNVGGNNYRLVTLIDFARGKVYVRDVLTHDAYDEGSWKT